MKGPRRVVPRLLGVCLFASCVLAGVPAAAQIATPDPPGPYVIDLHGVTAGLPQDAGFFPPVPTGTIIPARGFGVGVGAHIYLLKLGPGRLGVGASVFRVRGTASPPTPNSGSSSSGTPATPAPATSPDVEATLTGIAPQLSFNFGSADGWSYVSAGLGRATLTTAASAFGGGTSGVAATPALDAESGTRSSVNFGGGARWFAKGRMAFSFDLRFHLVSAGAETATAPATPGTTVVAASAGISLR